MSRPSNRSPSPRSNTQLSRSFSSPDRSRSIVSIAEESIARDFEDDDIDYAELAAQAEYGSYRNSSQRNLLGSQRRPSGIASGPKPLLGASQPESINPYERDHDAAISEERVLLEDNNLIQPQHSNRKSSFSSLASGSDLRRIISGRSYSTVRHKSDEADDVSGISQQPLSDEPTESTALLPDTDPPSDPEGGPPGKEDEDIDQQWEEAVLKGLIQTTWQREAKVLAKYTGPLIFTFILQTSLTITSVFTVGHIGKNELGAVSLGGMTASITGYAVYHGLATSLDTLCAQAYGSGKKTLVGLQLQRMVFFLWTCTIPIAALWLSAEPILTTIVPEKDIAVLAARYLRVLVLGAPGYALFESSKRYVQAQGRFSATLYVLLIAAPANILMHWLFVWHFGWGFIGCPIAIVITENLMPLLLFLYVRFIGGMECWPGFSRKAFKNWGPMVRLALPGFAMVIAEFLAFEILTLASARISATHLAANTILQSLSVVAYQLPFPLSIAGSTRVANLIGASLPEAAKVTTRVILVMGTIIGVFNMVMLSSLRQYIPHAFTQDPEVIALAAQTLPLNAAFQLFDALAAQCNGVLRGIGKQKIGGIVSLIAFYLIALPISFGTGFGLHWDLYGLWFGPAIALFVQASLEGWFIYKTSWQKASEEAAERNAAG